MGFHSYWAAPWPQLMSCKFTSGGRWDSKSTHVSLCGDVTFGPRGTNNNISRSSSTAQRESSGLEDSGRGGVCIKDLWLSWQRPARRLNPSPTCLIDMHTPTAAPPRLIPVSLNITLHGDQGSWVGHLETLHRCSVWLSSPTFIGPRRVIREIR